MRGRMELLRGRRRLLGNRTAVLLECAEHDDLLHLWGSFVSLILEFKCRPVMRSGVLLGRIGGFYCVKQENSQELILLLLSTPSQQ